MLLFADFTDLPDDLAGATIVPLHELLRVEGSAVTLAYYDSRRGYVIPDVRAMMRIGPQLSNDSLAEEVSAGIPGVTVHVVGAEVTRVTGRGFTLNTSAALVLGR